MSKVALSSQLFETAKIVRQVTQGVSLDKALSQADAVLRPGVQSLSYHVLRYLGLGQALTQKLVKKPPPLQVQALLWCALALCATQNEQGEEPVQPSSCLHEKDGSPHYHAYVLVSESVQAAKMHPKTRNFAPLVNGVLRGFLRNRLNVIAELEATRNQDEQDGKKQHMPGLPLLNFQPWWIELLQRDWAADWRRILQVAQCPAPMTLRVNVQQGTVHQAVQLLKAEGLIARIVGPYAVELDKAVPVENIPGFGQGYFSVQAEAAQRAAPLLLDPQWVKPHSQRHRKPLRILDACAAPGGKTAHILELAAGMETNVEVVALDVDAARLEKVRQTLDRLGDLGRHVELRAADAADPQAFSANEQFDAILLDAPCTASGIVRRHPDIRWLRRQADIGELARQQQLLLDALWPKLADGGRLLYCTCSVFKAEGEANAQNFVLRHNKTVSRRHAPGHILPLAIRSEGIETLNQTDKSATDGFYYALFEK